MAEQFNNSINADAGHIFVVAQYYYPEQFRTNDVCAEWVRRGYRVTVLTGIPNYPAGKFFDGYSLFKNRREVHDGVEIIRVPVIPRGKNRIMLTLNYFSFMFFAALWCMFTNIKPDLVFSFETSPIFQVIPAVRFAKKRNIPCYVYALDLWPESFQIMTGIKNALMVKLVCAAVDYVYKRSTRIFVPSRAYIDPVADRNVEREKIVYWPQYAEDILPARMKQPSEKIPDDGSFNIIFAGNLGFAQGLDALPKAAAELAALKPKRRVVFNIVGDGRYRDRLLEEIDKCGVGYMFRFHGRCRADEVPAYLAACDAAYLGYMPNALFEKAVPAKLQTYMACAMPIIACAEGESARIINESACGMTCACSDYKALARIIAGFAQLGEDELGCMSSNSLGYCRENFSKKELMDAMDEHFGLKPLKQEANANV